MYEDVHRLVLDPNKRVIQTPSFCLVEVSTKYPNKRVDGSKLGRYKKSPDMPVAYRGAGERREPPCSNHPTTVIAEWIDPLVEAADQRALYRRSTRIQGRRSPGPGTHATT